LKQPLNLKVKNLSPRPTKLPQAAFLALEHEGTCFLKPMFLCRLIRSHSLISDIFMNVQGD
jgi:hypothetical protein